MLRTAIRGARGARSAGVAALLSVFLIGSANAQITGSLSLEQAVQEAVAWHPNVLEAKASLDARKADVDAARIGYLPQISGGINEGYNNQIRSGWRPQPQLSASQMLYDFGKVRSSVEAARAGTRIGRANLMLAVDALIRDTGYAMVETQRNAALHVIAGEQLARIRDISGLVTDRFKKGAATRSDALQAQSRVEAAQATLAQIDAEQRRWSSNLMFLLGRDAPPSVKPDVPDWLEHACARTPADWGGVPTVMLADAQRDQAEADLHKARADMRPTLALAGESTLDPSRPTSRRSTYSFGLTVSSNIFGGTANRARARSADATLSAADAASRQARLQAGQLLAEAQQQIGGLSQQFQTLSSRQVNMTETGKLYRLQYLEMGTRTLVDLLNAEQELQQARFDAVNTAHDLRRLEIDCLYYSGRGRDAFALTGTTVQGVTL